MNNSQSAARSKDLKLCLPEQHITINVTIPAPTRKTRHRKVYQHATPVIDQTNVTDLPVADGRPSPDTIFVPDGYVEPEVLCKPHREQTMDAFRDQEEVNKIVTYLLSNEMYREHMLFVVGINLGLRYSDLRLLRFCDFINKDRTFKDELPLRAETKTRKRKTRNRHIMINSAVKNAILEFLRHNPRSIDDYLFENISNNRSAYKDENGNEKRQPLSNTAISNMIKDIAEAVGIEGRFASHSLRKTFGRLYLLNHKDDPTALTTLQLIFDHSSPRITLSYVGITADDLADAYRMNWGSIEDSDHIEINMEPESSNVIPFGTPRIALGK